MNDLPLKALKWDGDMLDTPLHTYQYLKDHDSKGKYMVKYAGKNRSLNEPARGFATIDEAKAWAWNHYNEKMQPYVKPAPTWIDASERLPEDDGKYLVATSCGKQWMGNYNLPPKPNEWMLNGWSMNGGWHPFGITHWMPIPEFSTMQNLHKGE